MSGTKFEMKLSKSRGGLRVEMILAMIQEIELGNSVIIHGEKYVLMTRKHYENLVKKTKKPDKIFIDELN